MASEEEAGIPGILRSDTTSSRRESEDSESVATCAWTCHETMLKRQIRSHFFIKTN
jgi:hypothetical protein